MKCTRRTIDTGGTLLLFREGRFTAQPGDLYVKDGIIAGVQLPGMPPPEDADTAGYQRLDASNRLIMPGLINMHTHAYLAGW